jgi:arginase
VTRPIAIIGAPSSLGVRPYDDGVARHLDRAPDVFRERRLADRLDAIDTGDVAPPPYRDYARPRTRPRNEGQVIAYSRDVADRVAAVIHNARFGLVLGGDCSVLLGCLLGARRSRGVPIGLAYVDAHADFSTSEESATGAVSGMSLGLAVGRGATRLARLAGASSLVDPEHVALVGRRDGPDVSHTAVAASTILDLSAHEISSMSVADITAATLARVAGPDVKGFWIHLDVDVLNSSVMPAVASPEPGGLVAADLARLLRPLVTHPRALGMNVSMYDPALDPDRSCARRLVALLGDLLAPRHGVDTIPTLRRGTVFSKA